MAQGDLDIALIDLVWIGNFVANNWIVPADKFISDPALKDPALDWTISSPGLDAFGSWNGIPTACRSTTTPV